MSDDALRIGATQAEADTRRRSYRGLLLAALVVQVIAGLLVLFFPNTVSDWLNFPVPSPDGWMRAVGLLLLIAAALYVPGYIEAEFARVPNLVGIGGRIALAILFLCLGGSFTLLALYEAIVAAALGWTYQRLIGAVLMSRP